MKRSLNLIKFIKERETFENNGWKFKKKKKLLLTRNRLNFPGGQYFFPIQWINFNSRDVNSNNPNYVPDFIVGSSTKRQGRKFVFVFFACIFDFTDLKSVILTFDLIFFSSSFRFCGFLTAPSIFNLYILKQSQLILPERDINLIKVRRDVHFRA